MERFRLKTATLNWNDQGTPVSLDFDDVYFSNQNGLAETRYVFLQGNDFPNRFLTHKNSVCTVAETGFGTGLNFLALWQSFYQFRHKNPDAALKKLHYISFEKHPLTVEDLKSTHQIWPELALFSAQLCAVWPMPLAGCQRVILDDGAVILDLWFGDVNLFLPNIHSELDTKIDAWFLDGFAPTKNPDMWSEQLFAHMAHCAAHNSTFATFTAAGFVRRGLQNAGFEVTKRKGFGQKREMLVGKIVKN